MSKTDVHCTRCGKEFEPFEDVVIVATGFIAPLASEHVAVTTDSPYLEVLCSTCRDPRPNRVVVEVEGNVVKLVRAERPEELVVFVYDRDLGRWYNRQHTVQQLNAVKEEA